MQTNIIKNACKISSYDSFNQDYNRFIFRTAMWQQHKNDCVWRKNKGHTSGVFHKSLEINRDMLLDLCIEGYLVKNDLINKEELIMLYDRVSIGKVDEQWALIHILCVETFISLYRGLI